MVANDALSFILSTYDKEVISSNSRLIEEKVLSCASENDPSQGNYFIFYTYRHVHRLHAAGLYNMKINTPHFFLSIKT